MPQIKAFQPLLCWRCSHKRHVAASKKYAPRVEKFDHVVQKIDHARSNLEQTFYHFTGFDSILTKVNS
jgi:hypothetical protein